MIRFYFRKLVRDKIPEILEAKDITVSAHLLKPDAIRTNYLKKLDEEVEELNHATTKQDTIGEIADIIELLACYAHHSGIGWDEIENERAKKNEKNGSFRNAIYIDSVTTADNHPEVAEYRTRTARFPEEIIPDEEE